MTGRMWEWSDHERLESKVDRALQFLQLLREHMAKLDDEIAKLTGDVAAENNVIASAITLINGIQGQIQAAVSAALAAGATPAQLQALSDLDTSLTGQSSALAAAVANNTAPPGQPNPVPPGNVTPPAGNATTTAGGNVTGNVSVSAPGAAATGNATGA